MLLYVSLSALLKEHRLPLVFRGYLKEQKVTFLYKYFLGNMFNWLYV